jgi:choline dehydrogenase-like flavoprotein
VILDFDDTAVGTEHVADVCIVGAGIAGIAIARELMGTPMSVLLVESGGVDPDPFVSRLNEGENTGLPLGLEAGRARAFGGTGTVWPGQCIRLDDLDLEPRDWVPESGWPLSATDLHLWYDRAEQWLGIPPRTDGEHAWDRFGLAPPALDTHLLVHKSAVYSPHPDVGRVHRRAFETSDQVRVLLHATATEIRTEGGAVASELEVRSLSGRTGRIRAGTFVLCGGGIENARLLLLSKLGNPDAVGHYLQDHPTFWADVESDRPAVLQQFYNVLGRGKVRYVPRVRLSHESQRRERTLNAIATFVYDDAVTPGLAAARELSRALQQRRLPAGLTKADVREALHELDGVLSAGWGRFFRGRPSAVPLDRIRLKILLEQAPDHSSRITLSSDRDALGLPRASVDWRLSEAERRTARVFTDALDRELRRLALGRLASTEWLEAEEWAHMFEDAYHPSGTTRMSTDAARGVVDRNCKVHGIDRLYVSGSSVFPTSGYANPTLTIVALALRLAHHLGRRSRQGSSWT